MKTKTLHLFGAGELLCEAAKVGIKLRFKVVVRTSNRLYDKKSLWVKKIRHLKVPLFVDNKLQEVMRKGDKIKKGDVGISFGAPWIFTAWWIAKWNKKLYNFHNRPLPKHRGAGGSTWMILMHERIGSSTVHEIQAGLDDGPIIKARTYRYPRTLTTPRDYDEYDKARCIFFIRRNLPAILKKGGTRKKQNSDLVTYWPRLNTEIHGWIDWRWNLLDIVTFCRAFGDPYDGAKTYIRNGIISLKKVRLVKSSQKHHPFQSGLIFRKAKNGALHVAHPEGELIIYEYKPYSKNVIPRTGDRLFTPIRILENAFASRVQYTPDGKMKIY